jgi:hypothetical protein
MHVTARGAILIGNKVPFLWEWLPATTAPRQDAAPTKKGSTSKDTRSWMLDKNVGEASGLDEPTSPKQAWLRRLNRG